MSKSIKFLLEKSNPEEQMRQLGLVPTHEVAEKVLKKLDSFGQLGIKGFDMAIRTLAILRNEEQHEEIPALVAGITQTYSRPFNFLVPKRDNDHGLIDGYTYGLHILPKSMNDVRIVNHEPGNSVSIIAENVISNRALLVERTVCPDEATFENGYFGVYPSNAASVISYLVLPKIEAVEIVGGFTPASLA